MFYPMNCEGQFYLFSNQVASRLLQVRARLPDTGYIMVQMYHLLILQAFHARGGKMFKIDDVFITGILAAEANITHM